MAARTKKTEPTQEEVLQQEAATQQDNATPANTGGRRTLTEEQRKRIFERNERNFKRQRSEILDYMRFSPRSPADIRRQQRFASLSAQILNNVSRLDNIAVIVGDEFVAKVANILRNIAAITRQADEAFSYGNGDKTAIIEANKELQALKNEALKALNELNSKVSSLGGKLSKANA